MRTTARLLALILILTLSAPANAGAWTWPWETAPASAPVEMPTPEPTEKPTPEPTPVPAPAPLDAGEDAVLRVYLKSLGKIGALALTARGEYAVDADRGFRFADGTVFEIAADGNGLLLTCGGLTLDMGASLRLTRHSADGALLIHETQRGNLYAGDLELIAKEGSIFAVLYIDVEDYLYGVVPYEMSDSFPFEALKAQAVAARTYALNRRKSAGERSYDVTDTTSDQVYRGLDPDTENAVRAVDETRGVVCLYDDTYATCFFTASNGGQTALPGQIWGGAQAFPYLDVRDDPYDLENPSSPVKTLTLPRDPARLDKAIKARLIDGLTEQMSALGLSDERKDIAITSVVSAEPVSPLFGEGNRMFSALRVGVMVTALRVYTGGPETTPDAQTTPANLPEALAEPLYVDLPFYGWLKDAYGLKLSATDCEVLSVAEEADGFRVESRRFGHGVGMSQRGAQQMAGAHGMDYLSVLAFYYPGAQLAAMRFDRADVTRLKDLPVSVGAARVLPTPAPTPAPLPALSAGERYAEVALSSRSSTLNVRAQPSTEAAVRGTLAHAQKVIVISDAAEGWSQIKTAELSGYVKTEYLR